MFPQCEGLHHVSIGLTARTQGKAEGDAAFGSWAQRAAAVQEVRCLHLTQLLAPSDASALTFAQCLATQFIFWSLGPP